MSRLDQCGLAGVAFASLLLGANSVAAPIIVDTVADSGPGSLREAIKTANINPGADTIEFDIADPGVQTIQVLTPLDTIVEAVTIDGYSQPGAQANTLPAGSNAVILIALDGAGAPFGTSALAVCAPDTVIRGLAMHDFPTAAVNITIDANQDACAAGSADGTVVAGNFIGVKPNGDEGGNGGTAIRSLGSIVQVGGDGDGERNVIAGNAGNGVSFSGAGVAGSKVLGNLIGFNPDSTPNGNKNAGVSFATAAEAVEVGTNKSPNRIANNGRGIFGIEDTLHNTFYANDIGPNDGDEIELCPVGLICPDGPTPNDPDDADSGGNGMQNNPVLKSAEIAPPDLSVSGVLDVPQTVTGDDYVLALYWSAACAPSGYGPGELFLGSATANLADLAEEFLVKIEAEVPEGGVLTATATTTKGDTSEFSECLVLPPPDLVFKDSFE